MDGKKHFVLNKFHNSNAKEEFVKLQQLQIRNIMCYDPIDKKLKKVNSKTLGYYREPQTAQYPLNLAKGYAQYKWRDQDIFYPYNKIFHYIMEDPKRYNEHIDFYTNRTTLHNIADFKSICLVATKFRGRIFLSLQDNRVSYFRRDVRSTLQFKLRQYVFADKPGDIPDTDKPVEEDKQTYAIFSAQLGNLKLLYSGEISGVDNAELLGDLSTPEVLQQVRISVVKVFSDKKKLRSSRWLSQAIFTGNEEFKVGRFDEHNFVQQPIQKLKTQDIFDKAAMARRLQFVHHVLNQISDVMSDVDCPHSSTVFQIERNVVNYEQHVGPNEYSLLDQAYIDMVGEL